MDFDIILQNNASKQCYVIQRQENVSSNRLFLDFIDIDMPVDMPSGEYTYAVIANCREDVTYDFKNVLLDTVVKTGEGNVLLKDLLPITGLLRYGDIKPINIYKSLSYNDNNKIYYYKG